MPNMHPIKGAYGNGRGVLFIIFINALDCYHVE